VLLHDFQEDECASDVVVVIAQRNGCGFTDCLQASEVNDGVEFVLDATRREIQVLPWKQLIHEASPWMMEAYALEDFLDSLLVEQIRLVERDRLSSQRFDTLQRFYAGSGEGRSQCNLKGFRSDTFGGVDEIVEHNNLMARVEQLNHGV
jgi:hypothetical protein